MTFLFNIFVGAECSEEPALETEGTVFCNNIFCSPIFLLANLVYH